MLTLGIDSSTQGVKAVICETASGRLVASASVRYGDDLPQYGAPDGFLPNDDPHVREADPTMWREGLDLVLKRLAETGAPLAEVEAIGGCAQQHATVCLDEAGRFSRPRSPIWMDVSAATEAQELAERFGDRLRLVTGSNAEARFAAAQVKKFFRENPVGYGRTKRIHLLSSYLTSLLVGTDAPVDSGDGAGMNLLDLVQGVWSAEVAEAVAPDLIARLPKIAVRGETLPLARRFASCGLRPGIPVVPFTGDNPAALVGCGAAESGVGLVSLGTSDTFSAALPSLRTSPTGIGHVFGNPLGGFMALVCVKNGSLARERIRRELGVDWEFFDEGAWKSEVAKRGEFGERKAAFPFFETEIAPVHAATGIEANFDWTHADAATQVRAIVRGQIENLHRQAYWAGTLRRIVVTGGASRSRGMVETIAEVFGVPVSISEATDAAAVGGALLAARALNGDLKREYHGE